MRRSLVVSAVILMTACVGALNDPKGTGASSPSPSPSGFAETHQPRRDLLYLAASDLGTDRVVGIELPEGKILYELPATGLVRDGSGVSRPHVTAEFAFFSRTALGDDIREFRTTVERIDLRTGERRSVEAGTVTFAGILAIGSHDLVQRVKHAAIDIGESQQGFIEEAVRARLRDVTTGGRRRRLQVSRSERAG